MTDIGSLSPETERLWANIFVYGVTTRIHHYDCILVTDATFSDVPKYCWNELLDKNYIRELKVRRDRDYFCLTKVEKEREVTFFHIKFGRVGEDLWNQVQHLEQM